MNTYSVFFRRSKETVYEIVLAVPGRHIDLLTKTDVVHVEARNVSEAYFKANSIIIEIATKYRWCEGSKNE